MSKIYFTADHHFGHRNIITHCNRPFTYPEEMDEAMVDRWNSTVKPGDIVYHLGDFTWNNDADQLLPRLYGDKRLIAGNHDPRTTRHAKLWQSVQYYEEIVVDGMRVVLCHYRIYSWHNIALGSIHLHGHSHGKCKRYCNVIDVGVDCSNFTPMTLHDWLDSCCKYPTFISSDYADDDDDDDDS